MAYKTKCEQIAIDNKQKKAVPSKQPAVVCPHKFQCVHVNKRYINHLFFVPSTVLCTRVGVMIRGAACLFPVQMFRLNASPSEDNPSLIKCVVIIAGMYFFYLLEFTLHLFSGGHSHVSMHVEDCLVIMNGLINYLFKLVI